MASNWTQLIKQIAEEARKASKPCDFTYGQVISVNPLKISLNQQMILTSEFLVITQTANNANLVIGDEVLLIKKEGGQDYALIDKVVSR